VGIFTKIFQRQKFSLRHVLALFSFIFVAWAVYRYFPGILPPWFEEGILKPVIWLLPTFWLVKKIERQPLSSLGITAKNLFPSLYWGVGLGIVFAFEGLLTNIFKYKGLQLVSLDYTLWGFLGALGLSFVTAFSEESVFRGYIFNRLWQIWQSEWLANIVSAFLFVLIHLPVGVFVLGYTPVVMLGYLFFVFVYGFGAAFVFARTGNLISSVLLHVFWSWPIILFR
jgi:membrane protease YdiL (CAAX protease family)